MLGFLSEKLVVNVWKDYPEQVLLYVLYANISIVQVSPFPLRSFAYQVIEYKMSRKSIKWFKNKLGVQLLIRALNKEQKSQKATKNVIITVYFCKFFYLLQFKQISLEKVI